LGRSRQDGKDDSSDRRKKTPGGARQLTQKKRGAGRQGGKGETSQQKPSFLNIQGGGDGEVTTEKKTAANQIPPRELSVPCQNLKITKKTPRKLNQTCGSPQKQLSEIAKPKTSTDACKKKNGRLTQPVRNPLRLPDPTEKLPTTKKLKSRLSPLKPVLLHPLTKAKKKPTFRQTGIRSLPNNLPKQYYGLLRRKDRPKGGEGGRHGFSTRKPITSSRPVKRLG